MATDRSELSEEEWIAERERVKARLQLSAEIDARILSLAWLAVEVQRGTAGDDAVDVIREVTRVLETYRAERAIPEWTAAVVRAVAHVYQGVRDADAAPDVNEYDRRLREALAPLSLLPGELEDLALTWQEIRRNGKGGSVEAAQAALAPHLDDMLARRGEHPVTGEPSDEAKAMRPLLDGAVSASTLRNRRREVKERGEPRSVATLADARAYLAELALDDVERARRFPSR